MRARRIHLGAAGSDTLGPGEEMKPGQFLIAPNGRYIFYVGPHGNSLFDISTGEKRLYWGGERPDLEVVRLLMQTDGNLVAYDSKNHSVWYTATHAINKGGWNYGFHQEQGPGNALRILNDGNLVIINKDGRWVWDRLSTSGHGGFLNDIADAITSTASTVGKAAVDLTQSPAWQVIAGAAFFIPGIGTAVSAGMEGAALLGKIARGKSNVFDAAAQGLNIAGQAGFDAGLGVIAQNPTVQALGNIRAQLSSDPIAQAGFDTALALTKGMATSIPPADVQNPDAKAAFYTAVGLRGAPPEIIATVTPTAITTPQARAGFTVGVALTSRAKPTFVRWLLQRLRAELRYLHVVR